MFRQEPEGGLSFGAPDVVYIQTPNFYIQPQHRYKRPCAPVSRATLLSRRRPAAADTAALAGRGISYYMRDCASHGARARLDG